MKKISLTRTRPERSGHKRLSVGQTERIMVSIQSELKSVLQREAEAKGYSLSLYINLILTGQEKPPDTPPKHLK